MGMGTQILRNDGGYTAIYELMGNEEAKDEYDECGYLLECLFT
jgi:hypothetical protein